MIVLTIRSDKPEAEIGLFKDKVKLEYEVWLAHYALSESLHKKLEEVVGRGALNLNSIEGIVVYKGPGSFTGLRIGISVANALAMSLQIPIIGIEHNEKWLERGLEAIGNNKNDGIVLPAYGAPVHITTPKK